MKHTLSASQKMAIKQINSLRLSSLEEAAKTKEAGQMQSYWFNLGAAIAYKLAAKQIVLLNIYDR